MGTLELERATDWSGARSVAGNRLGSDYNIQVASDEVNVRGDVLESFPGLIEQDLKTDYQSWKQEKSQVWHEVGSLRDKMVFGVVTYNRLFLERRGQDCKWLEHSDTY